MKNLFVSYLYRLRHDLAFKITLIIGAGLSVFLTLIYILLSVLIKTNMIDAQSMLVSSLSPSSNFGLAVPVNLITFTVLEFNQGSIRNKIIAGHSKARIYSSLILNGLVFTFSLMIVYALVCTGLGAFSGWALSLVKEIEQPTGSLYPNEYVWKMVLMAAFCYLSIVCFTIFFSSLFRNIGPSIPVVIVVLVFASTLAPIIVLVGSDNAALLWVFRIIDPLFGLSAGETEIVGQVMVPTEEGMVIQAITEPVVKNETLISCICSNLVYAAGFYFGGLLIFKKRDVK